jgi:hypothetical protein
MHLTSKSAKKFIYGSTETKIIWVSSGYVASAQRNIIEILTTNHKDEL